MNEKISIHSDILNFCNKIFTDMRSLAACCSTDKPYGFCIFRNDNAFVGTGRMILRQMFLQYAFECAEQPDDKYSFKAECCICKVLWSFSFR